MRAGEAQPAEDSPPPDVVPPVEIAPGNFLPELSEPSALLEERDCRALAAAVPIRHRWRRWHLLYSTGRDGISLQTLYRSASVCVYLLACNPTVCTNRACWSLQQLFLGMGSCVVTWASIERILCYLTHSRSLLEHSNPFAIGTATVLQHLQYH